MIARVEPLVVLAITPLLLFPSLRPTWTAVALGLLALVWIARAIVAREPWPVTPFNAALLLFCLTIPLAVWASASPDLTLPKLLGLILGLAAFRVVAFSAVTDTGRGLALAVFVLLGLAMWALGLLGIRLAALAPLVQRMPAAVVSLPGAPDQGINPNQLAGVLVLYLPFAFAIILLELRQRRILLALLLSVVALAAVATLILTRSRSGWVGLAVATLALVLMLIAVHGRRFLRRAALAVTVVVLAAALVGGAILLPQHLGQRGTTVPSERQVGDVMEQLSFDSRIEIWSRALYALQDFPFTGVGLGTFRRVVNLLYPLFLVPPDTDIGHAHNIFLQVGVDLGLGGLIAYVALLIVAGVAAWQTARAASVGIRFLALGLLAALIGLNVYGFADALAPGSKPGLAFWLVLGLIAGMANDVAAGAARPGARPVPEGPQPLQVGVGAEGAKPLSLRQGDLGDVEEPVRDGRDPDAAGIEKQGGQ